MKREQQTTPTPWQVSYTVPSDRLDNQTVVAITASHPEGGGQTIAEALEADAQYIVTAVNSHEKLIEALQSAIKWLDFVNEKLSDPEQLAANMKKYGGVKYVLQFGEGAGYRASEARAALASAEAATDPRDPVDPDNYHDCIDIDNNPTGKECEACRREAGTWQSDDPTTDMQETLADTSAEIGVMATETEFNCANCGRHYEATPDDDLHDVKDRIAVDGFCCDYCKEESDSYEDGREAATAGLSTYDNEGVEVVRCNKCQEWIALGLLEADGKCPECGDPNEAATGSTTGSDSKSVDYSQQTECSHGVEFGEPCVPCVRI